MKSLFNDKQAESLIDDPLAMRVYTSQLLGRESDLVLHGGGNTSVKDKVVNLFGESEDVLFVKGSGWDLATIQRAGFTPVKMDVLLKMAELDELTDTEMVRVQRSAMTDPNAPNPSVEAILHAIIPFKYVDHTHADAVVTITNTPKGAQLINEIYGDRVFVVPYVMPGFILSKKVYEMTRDVDWNKYEALILMHHGVFTFGDDAKKSYEKMISIVTEAEQYLQKRVTVAQSAQKATDIDLLKLAEIRQAVSRVKGDAMLAKLNREAEPLRFSNDPQVESLVTRGPLTPDHVIRTKRVALCVNSNVDADLNKFSNDYQAYFKRNAHDGLTCLDDAPRWAVWPGQGTLAFGRSLKEADIVTDITRHTIKAIAQAECLGGWKALGAKDVFDIEYWVLEQAKLKKGAKPSELQGKIALVTGAASGIGKACVEALNCHGAVVGALDINENIEFLFEQKTVLGIKCDVTREMDIQKAVERIIMEFGGLDILISNAGIFPAGRAIEDLSADIWQKSMDVNLSSHQKLLKEAIPYLKRGIDSAVVIVASKNVPAPGPGVSAYSVAKAGLTQLARVAALELGEANIRVNVVHPNQIFDTAIWTDEVLANRAKHYGISVEEYKTNNLLGVEITSKDVARLVRVMVTDVFSKTTGTQVSIDGGNDRVI